LAPSNRTVTSSRVSRPVRNDVFWRRAASTRRLFVFCNVFRRDLTKRAFADVLRLPARARRLFFRVVFSVGVSRRRNFPRPNLARRSSPFQATTCDVKRRLAPPAVRRSAVALVQAFDAATARVESAASLVPPLVPPPSKPTSTPPIVDRAEVRVGRPTRGADRTDDLRTFPPKAESTGTPKRLSFYPYIRQALDSDVVLFVDDLDARLRPTPTRALVLTFLNPATSSDGAQLVFSTYSTWFLARDLCVATKFSSPTSARTPFRLFYSLAEFMRDADFANLGDGEGLFLSSDAASKLPSAEKFDVSDGAEVLSSKRLSENDDSFLKSMGF